MNLDFYKALHYPVPKNKEVFVYNTKIQVDPNAEESDTFSRTEKSKLQDEYKDFIIKNIKLRKYIPGISAVYLCNSITFNALHENSDIDVFIITKKNRIWRAKLRTTIITTITGTRRQGTNIRKKFCTSFYLSENCLNINSLRLKEGDIYLPYRIAHLVPLYHEESFDINNIYKENSRIQFYLPNLELHQNIFLDIPIEKGSTKIKRMLDGNKDNLIISTLNNIVGMLQKLIIKHKTKKQGKNIRYIIANNNILKFHKDKRRQYYFLFKKQRRTQR